MCTIHCKDSTIQNALTSEHRQICTTIPRRTTTLEQSQWPFFFKLLVNDTMTPLQKARALLNDYTKSDSATLRFITGQWNRSHVMDVARIVKHIDLGVIKSLEELKKETDEIDIHNDSGALSTRLACIFNTKEQQPDISPEQLAGPSESSCF